ncbi:MAG: V-type ATP synthase subunit F [Treponema sp.]|nr:V-type ATP synthase subunit F [Treponema sp.]
MDYFFIGDPELVTAFRFVGIEGLSVDNADSARQSFRRITEGFDEVSNMSIPTEGCRILIMTQEIAEWLGDILLQWQLSGQYPLVVEIPGMMGKIQGGKTLVDSIREAIGIHV